MQCSHATVLSAADSDHNDTVGGAGGGLIGGVRGGRVEGVVEVGEDEASGQVLSDLADAVGGGLTLHARTGSRRILQPPLPVATSTCGG
jgi:hypothetical protein